MGIRGSGQHWEETGGIKIQGKITMYQGKNTKIGDSERSKKYLGMNLSRPLDLKGVHPYMIIERKNGRNEEK